ncbi:hypothetical protein [Mycolicibacterium fortuitum]|uniref:hypothetical protein n=1 Tax=Mycolicibacterium fortuitum TaxID=1766 RepID=UPI0007FC9FE9|nr:hypothetical protein [Mycolicibacterium fortuitum]OBK57451.1 hypothetical protein A5654_03550 [Mycolicibacterium fortuitum]
MPEPFETVLVLTTQSVPGWNRYWNQSNDCIGARGVDCNLRLGEAVDVTRGARYAEAGQHNASVVPVAGDRDVGGFDVAVQQTLLMGVVEGAGDGGRDRADLVHGQTGRVLLAQKFPDI